MESTLLKAVLGAVILLAMALFGRAFLKGSKMLGGFWDKRKPPNPEA